MNTLERATQEIKTYADLRNKNPEIEPYSKAQLRMACVEVASRGREGHSPDDVIEAARKLSDFVFDTEAPKE